MKSLRIKKFLALFALVAFISVSLSSCHRYGCPNQISKVEQPEQEQC